MEFLIHFRPGNAWVPGKSVFEQDLEEHGAYMQALFDSNKIVIGGPFLNDRGGMVVIEVASEQEAGHILEECPSIVNGVFEAEMHPVMLVFDRSAGVSLRTFK